jgi:hypothetical protein
MRISARYLVMVLLATRRPCCASSLASSASDRGERGSSAAISSFITARTAVAEAAPPLSVARRREKKCLNSNSPRGVTNNKYMATPRGLFEFKHFFSRRLATDNGGAASATAVRAVMKELIAAEDPRAPLSDAELARLLAQQGLRVARRTITKYRALMRMPSVDVRRADNRGA